MAKVEYSFPIEKIQGKISKKHKIGFIHRKQGAKNFTQAYGVRSTPVTANELTHRQKFAAVTTSARARMIDPAFIQQDQAAYQANKHLYNSLWHYVFTQEWAAY